MPDYTMKTAEGRTLTVSLPMKNAPPIGTWVTIAGETMQRQPDFVMPAVTRDRHFASRSMPRWYKHHKGSFNDKGMPQFTSKREIDETVARSSGEEPQSYYIYD